MVAGEAALGVVSEDSSITMSPGDPGESGGMAAGPAAAAPAFPVSKSTSGFPFLAAEFSFLTAASPLKKDGAHAIYGRSLTAIGERRSSRESILKETMVRRIDEA